MKKRIFTIWIIAGITLSVHVVQGRAAVDILPTVETAPVYGSGDVADDPAIWIHPANTSLSIIIGVSKNTKGGLHVYDLKGIHIQFVQFSGINNVDLRYNFPLGGKKAALVTASNLKNNSIAVYKVNPSTRQLENVAVRTIKTNFADGMIYGLCMYHSRKTRKFYSIVNDNKGNVEQWELYDNGGGKVDAKKVRSFNVGSTTEGCVADDELAQLYISEENVGIWKYGAEPEDVKARTLVDRCGGGGHLKADVEGLTIYYTREGTGYLIASSQGDNTFAIYERQGKNKYIGTFRISADGSIDGCSATDGIDVTNANLGTTFPKGLFVAHDSENSGGCTSNYKLVPWDSIAKAFYPHLEIDTSWNPRYLVR